MSDIGGVLALPALPADVLTDDLVGVEYRHRGGVSMAISFCP